MSSLRVERVADQLIADDVRRAGAGGRAGKPGSVSVTATGVTDATTAQRVETGGGIPWLPIAALVGLALAALLGGGIAFGLFGGVGATPTPDPSTAISSPTSGAVSPTPSPTPTATPTPPPVALVFPPNTVFDGCLVIDPQGNTTVLAAAFTVFGPQPGDYRATIARSPSGPLSGSGTATDGGNPVVVPMRARLFGTYDMLSISAPDGTPVALGPLAALFPLDLNAATNRPTGCEPSALLSPTPQVLAGRAYLAAVAPVNSAQVVFFPQAQSWTDAVTSAQAQADAAALLAALEAVHPRLLELAAAYPPAADELRAADDAVLALIADLSDLARLEDIGIAPWLDRYEADLVALSTASARAREALGLPPLS